MADTLKNIFLKARALLDEYSEDGVLIPDTEIIDMQGKAVPLADMVHKELYEIAAEDDTIPVKTISDITDTTQVNYKADQAIVYYIAARLAPFGKKALVQFYEDKYEALKLTCRNKAIEVPITDAYNFTEE